MRNDEGKIESQKKVHTRICVREITLLAACLPMSFLSLFCLLPRLFLLRFYVEKNIFAPEPSTPQPPSVYGPAIYIF